MQGPPFTHRSPRWAHVSVLSRDLVADLVPMLWLRTGRAYDNSELSPGICPLHPLSNLLGLPGTPISLTGQARGKHQGRAGLRKLALGVACESPGAYCGVGEGQAIKPDCLGWGPGQARSIF